MPDSHASASAHASASSSSHVAAGRRKKTSYGRRYEVLAGPFRSNDRYGKVYVVRDGHDGVVRLMGHRELERLNDSD